ncbi:CxxxxCH/CxxCH domain-containing protein [Spirochaetota bacterium]
MNLYPPSSGKHTEHLSKGSVCIDCHTNYSNNENHKNGIHDIDTNINLIIFNDERGTTSWSEINKDCSTVSCHCGSIVSTNWYSQITSCSSCHTPGEGNYSMHFISDFDQGTVHGPYFNEGPENCTPCHGSDLTGGTGSSCGSCHANWKTDCLFCHGGTDNTTGAPPSSVSGETTTTARGVGAHTIHLTNGPRHRAFQCNVCHTVPPEALTVGHIDPSPAELNFNGLAENDGASSSFDGTTCQGTYCHGGTLSGGTNTSPNWTTVNGSETACGSCHGLPPTQNHPTLSNCEMCHSLVVNASQQIIAPQLHIDGQIDLTANHPTGYDSGTVHGPDFNQWPGNCTPCHGTVLTGGTANISCDSCHAGWKTQCNFCHGSAGNPKGAPPGTVDGRTDTNLPEVGSHQPHLSDGTTHNPFDCSTCHNKPTDALTPGHVDSSPAEVVFTGYLSNTTYDPQTHTCNNIYCHGNGQGSGPDLSFTGGSNCGTCHPPDNPCQVCHDDRNSDPITLSGKHENHKGFPCYTCHRSVVDNLGTTVTNKALHMNGYPNVNLVLGTWKPTIKACSANGLSVCHGTNDNWFWY